VHQLTGNRVGVGGLATAIVFAMAVATSTPGTALAEKAAEAEEKRATPASGDRAEVSANREWLLPSLPRFQVELWDDGYYLRLIEIDDCRLLLAEGPQGGLLYDGPIDTPAHRESLDPVARRKLDRVMDLPGVMMFVDAAGMSGVEASFDDHWPGPAEGELAVTTDERTVYEGVVSGPGGRPLHAIRRMTDHRLIFEQSSLRRIEVTAPRQALVLVPAETF